MEFNETFEQENKVNKENEKKRLIEKLKETADFFGLAESNIENFINEVEFSKGGVSPMFLSPGFGINNSYKPRILTTVLANSLDVYLHELRHGLHYQICRLIFESSELSVKAFRLFGETVLKDREFMKLIEKNGTGLQREFIRKAQELRERENISAQDIANLSVPLGALTYQHAYFVDPRMCEAVASFGDSGSTRLIGKFNRMAASLIPHDTLASKGYGDIISQSMFKNATLFQKALLVRKDGYKRQDFFNSK